MPESLKAAYLANIIRREGCWAWNGTKHDCGYGLVLIAGERAYAHRLSYELHKGPIPAGHVVLHLCHNPECTNPDHLEHGTQKQNMRTSLVAGRLQRRIPLGDMPSLHQARADGVTLQGIADRYGCTKQAVRHMLNAHPELAHG